MKRRLGKFGTIFLALALALTLTGAGFAYWSQTLYIEGTVDTGNVDCQFTCVSNDSTADAQNDPKVQGTWDGDCNWTGDRYDKNVADLDVVLSNENRTMTVNLNNGYPCYSPSVCFWIYNDGSIPVRIKSLTVDPPYADPIHIWDDVPPHSGSVRMDLDNDGDYDVTVFLSGLNEYGLPGYYQYAEIDAYGSIQGKLYFHVWNQGDTWWLWDEGNDAAECLNATFTIDFEIAQYNVVP